MDFANVEPGEPFQEPGEQFKEPGELSESSTVSRALEIDPDSSDSQKDEVESWAYFGFTEPMLNTLVIIMATIHVYVFCMESILWGKPKTNRTFNVTDANAQVLRTAMFNQGFYNLFLACGLLIGFFWTSDPIRGRTLEDFAALSILGAGLVLWLSEPKMIRGALIQAGPAAAYWIVRLFFS